MKKNTVLLILLFISLLGCRGFGVRGSGNLEDEPRDIEDFSKIEVGGAFNVQVTVGEPTSLVISTDDNLLKYIRTRVVGNTLEIDTKKDLNPKTDLKIKITTPELVSIESSGANSVDIDGISCERFSVELSGAGNIDLEGSANSIRVDISGAGSVDAKHLIAEKAKVDLSGASSAKIYASESIDVDVSGVGTVDFYGDPENVKSDISGIGSINRK